MRRFTLLVSLLLASCAMQGIKEISVGQCSDSPENTATQFLRGLKEMSLELLRAMTPEGLSMYAIFGAGDSARGKAVIAQLIAHPEILGGTRGCRCALIELRDTPVPTKKIVVVERLVAIDDDTDHTYRITLLVEFDPRGNCVTAIAALNQWERML